MKAACTHTSTPECKKKKKSSVKKYGAEYECSKVPHDVTSWQICTKEPLKRTRTNKMKRGKRETRIKHTQWDKFSSGYSDNDNPNRQLPP